jgi:urease accessory protein
MPRVRRPPSPLPAPTLLRLMWLASPALPVGGFSYSEGLEPAVEAGVVSGEDGARRWLLGQLELVMARSELPVLAQAMRAWRRDDRARIAELAQWVRTTRESHEFRRMGEQMGYSLAEWLKAQHPGDAQVAALAALAPSPSWPIAFALAACRAAAPEREALLAFGFGWIENMVQAALKAVPLGQSAGQRLLGALADALPAAVERALQMPDGERQAMSPMLAILSARHETQYSRLFRS